ncbi:hypothetical protein CHU93_13745 [Sandarakinorhabdus cyanobacteriorum]|uniref:Uncharacterized protein n=1 Tax=Sandarakinorhabdus cyanobacteriorum TaxID=1981098 RepID=A0A255Y9K4_9SPHN|nr:DUF692 domain-containing protein [Sandarakinorhabdus cyanobacteriorum]OYQ25315.1 hypothetical protein CHU93_13745 [Sandarakinorhabdus cyanobacteriorum]
MIPPPQRSLYGLGLRRPHHADFLAGDVPVDFVEVISENFMVDGGRPAAVLAGVRQHHDVILHGVSMSLGTATGLDTAYLARLRQLADTVQPLWVSDHLAWTGIDGVNSHDLLPIPYSEEALAVVARNIDQAQAALGRPILVENPSTYLEFHSSTLAEWEFLTALVQRTGCGLLLDVNNIHVSAHNHGRDPLDWLDGLPWHAVRQLHLAGPSQGQDGLLIDTHDTPVPGRVWALYEEVRRRTGPVAVMIERDDDIPPLADLLAELDRARLGEAEAARP